MVAASCRSVRWTVALAVSAAIAAWPPLGNALELDRSVLPAEPWRLLTCHLTHWRLDHLCWNLAVFAALGAMMEIRSRARFVGCVVVSALVISATLVVAQPELVLYRGLSGIDSALFAAVVVVLLRDAVATRKWQTASWLALAITALLAKIAFESVTGRCLFVDTTTFRPIPLVHAVGAIVGVLVALVPAPGRAAAPALEREHDELDPATPASGQVS
ncbi:MAG TPA: rhombosortase [Planctomycetota bacterium]|nr:rhombosortase [Planctomycetota bacterium]